MDEGLLRKLKMVRLRDLGHVFLFLLALLPAAFLRRKRPHLWLVCEGEREAQDNGYWFFRYLRREQPQVDAVYAVADDAPARERVAELGETVDYGSFRHWILYLAAEVNISSQKSGDPNAAIRLMVADKLEEITRIQVEAIKNLQIDKITVWDSGAKGGDGKNTTADFITGLYKSIPPLNEMFDMAGMKLPEYLGKDKSGENPELPEPTEDKTA